MNQLEFDFGPEHLVNKPRTDQQILIGLIRRITPLSILDDILGVQPMSTAENSSLFRLQRVKPYVPTIEEFELTEPYCELDEVQGCFGWEVERNHWQRFGSRRKYIPCED